MAHAVETMAYAGETPWHGLGIQVSDRITPEEMLRKAGLNWQVKKSPLFYGVDPSNSRQQGYAQNDQIEGLRSLEGRFKKFALYRDTDGKFLDIVHSENWQPVQNHRAFEFFNEFIRRGEMQMETAGSLDGGRRVFALAKTNEGFSLANGKDDIESYLLFSNPHVYGEAINVRFTPVRVVCQNTLSYALNLVAEQGVRVNHNQIFDDLEVKKTLGIAREQLKQYQHTASFLSQTRYTDASVQDYLQQVFPVRSQRRELTGNALRAYELLDTQPGAEYARGTYWNAFNVVTYLTDHKLGTTRSSRLTSAWYGANRLRKERALTLAIEYAKAA